MTWVTSYLEMIRNANATLRNLEYLVAQISRLLLERLLGALPSNIVVNQKEYQKV